MTTHQTQHSRWRWQAAVILLLLAGFALRLYRIDAQALTGDEAFTIVNWTREPLSTVFSTIALIDPQPPATLLTVIGWTRLAGDSVFALRFLAALASTIALAAIYALGKALSNRHTAITSLGLAAINPFQLWYAQDGRGYALWIAISAVSAWALLLATQRPERRRRWVGYAAAVVLGLYTYYLELFFIAMQGLYVLLLSRQRRGVLKPWLLSQIVIGALVAPWYLQPSLRSSGYQPTASAPNLPYALASLFFGETAPAELLRPLFSIGSHEFSLMGLLATMLIIGGGTVLARSREWQAALFLPLYTIGPAVLLALLAAITGQGFFRPRYVAPSSTALILMTAFLIERAVAAARRSEKTSRVMAGTGAIAIAGVVLAASITSVWTYHFEQSKAPPWPDIVAALHEQTGTGDLIVRNFPDPAFDYYYQGSAPWTLLPESPDAPLEDTHSELAKLVEQHDSLWFLPVPSPDYDDKQVVTNWLLGNTQLVSEQWIGPTHLMQFSSWQVDEGNVEQALEIVYADSATLRGFSVTPPLTRWERGTTVHVATIWQPLSQTDQDLTLFVHLLGPPGADGSPLWAQDDHAPQGGRISTTTWEPGTLLRDIAELTIPADAPAGEYILTIGLYDRATGERIAVEGDVAQVEPGGATLVSFSLPPR